MSTRSAKFTIETKKKERYSDFLINFDKNPVTGYLAKATDREAIEGSMRNLLLTETGEWPFESTLGSKINSSLFELFDSRTKADLETSISEAIRYHEPRVELVNVSAVQNNTENNSVYITIVYSIINIPDEVFSFELLINRVR